MSEQRLETLREQMAYAQRGLDPAEAPYQPHGLAALRSAEALLAEVDKMRDTHQQLCSLVDLYEAAGASATILLDRVRRLVRPAPPSGIAPECGPCWVLPDAGNGQDERHWPSRAAALADLGRGGDPDHGRNAELRHNDAACWTATTVCGYQFDYDLDGQQHWPDKEVLRGLLARLDYVIGQDGTLSCPSAADGCGCPVTPGVAS